MSLGLTLRLIACSPLKIAVDDKTLWTHLDFNNDQWGFHFVVVSDGTGRHRPGVFRDAMHRVNLLRPEFVMPVGYLIEADCLRIAGGCLADRNAMVQAVEQIRDEVSRVGRVLAGNVDFDYPYALEETVRKSRIVSRIRTRVT